MKWIEIRSGKYKYVEDDDSRPAVVLKSRGGAPNLHFTPSWKRYEQNVWTPDPEFKSNNKKMDQFIDEREHELKTDPKARRWEEGRKKEWARGKPYWRKKVTEAGY